MIKALAVCLLLAGCAQQPPSAPRFYTDQEDAQLREMCEPHGCVTVPTPMFEAIIRALNKYRGREA